MEQEQTKPQKRSKNYYFTKVHEQAIVDYIKSDDLAYRAQLYTKFIGPVFDEMVNKIIFTYKFTTLPNIDSLREECKVWLVTVLNKFEIDKGYKAFSYFSVITKNWFIHKVKRATQQVKREIQFYDIPKDIECKYMITENNYLDSREEDEFWIYLRAEMEDWDDEELKINERKVLNAIKILFDNIDEIEIFNKKAFFLYIRELTSLSTKQIVVNLTRLKEKYYSFHYQWKNGLV